MPDSSLAMIAAVRGSQTTNWVKTKGKPTIIAARATVVLPPKAKIGAAAGNRLQGGRVIGKRPQPPDPDAVFAKPLLEFTALLGDQRQVAETPAETDRVGGPPGLDRRGSGRPADQNERTEPAEHSQKAAARRRDCQRRGHRDIRARRDSFPAPKRAAIEGTAELMEETLQRTLDDLGQMSCPSFRASCGRICGRDATSVALCIDTFGIKSWRQVRHLLFVQRSFSHNNEYCP